MFKRAFLALALSLALVPAARSQTWPDKPVKVILPFPTGTGPNTVMRLVAERLARIWGQQVIIENRAGANGWIAMEAAKRAAPDGYTLLQADAPPITVAPHLWKKLPYDPVKDFEPVAGLYRTYYFVTVAADSKWNTVGELVAAAKANPGGLSYGSSGNGGNLHLGGAMMERATGTKMLHVPFKETTQIYIAVNTGDISWAVGTASTTQPMLKANKVKYLAITAPRRSPLFPEVPTVAESQGPANYELQTWVALYAPAGVPKAITTKINADVNRVLQDPEVRSYFGKVGFDALVQTPAEVQEMARKDSAMFKDVVKDLNISLD
ncbi:MAG: tripartite tricarboxylate transporter substrate binding protein [Piscinibacter sp.]|uniref:Bug family tripartite tricarboxylate transporter substrate binding protein n=1 Tax=Piscinibacter TaxID=1114981 RepID=UPI0013E37E72|nr:MULTISPECIES: tripartite tricarboxylate transporter substrate binding protein [Piscinibacter]MCW5666248.1 tripartite tricarboxylate transporter substrate binding protein [Piscinibacter sp.]